MFQGDIYSVREGLPTSRLCHSFPPPRCRTFSCWSMSEAAFSRVSGITPRQLTPTPASRSPMTPTNETINYARGGAHSMSTFSTTSTWGRGRRSSGERRIAIRSLDPTDLSGISLVPADLNMQLFSSFVQDEVAIVPDHLFLTFGAKLEHNHYTGFGIMPSARVAWTPSQPHTLWAAVSKTERTPSEQDAALRADVGCVRRSRRNSSFGDTLRQSACRQRGVRRL